MPKANIPSLSTEKVLDEAAGLFGSSWARYMHELWARIGGGDLYNLGGLLVSNTTAVGNITGGEDNLITYSLAKNTMHNNGDALEVTAYGTTAANGNNKTIKLVLGSTTLFTTGAVAFNNKDWCLRATITQITSTTQSILAEFQGDFGLLTNTVTITAGAENLATTLTLKCTGTSGSSTTDDIIQKGLIIKLFPNF